MPRSVSNKRRNRKRGTYAIVGAFSVIIPFILLSYYVFGQHPKISSTLQLVSINRKDEECRKRKKNRFLRKKRIKDSLLVQKNITTASLLRYAQVFRHGERTPTHFYPNDPFGDSKFWPDGFGALTKKGKQQMYKFGKFLRERYSGFLNEKYAPEDMYMMSSDHDRCLMSAQLCLAGLYPPVGQQIWNEDLAWQPIPVHTVPRHLDKLIVVKKQCPKYERELNKTYYTSYFEKVNQDNAGLFKYLSENSGMKVENLVQLESLYNTLEVEANLGLKLPDWTEKIYNQKLKSLAALSLATFTFTDATKRLKGGPILAEVVDHMSRKILGSLKPNRILYLYSSHDLTMISVLRALGFEELLKPDYGAALIFELHQPLEGGDHLVELLYLNNTEESIPVRFKIPACDEMCKLKDFLRITKPMIPENWEAECQDV